MADATGTLKSSWNTIKAHWVLFLVVIALAIFLYLMYDIANPGKIAKKYDDAPILGAQLKKAREKAAAAGAGA